MFFRCVGATLDLFACLTIRAFFYLDGLPREVVMLYTAKLISHLSLQLMFSFCCKALSAIFLCVKCDKNKFYYYYC